MAKRGKRGKRGREAPRSIEYTDDEGNVLALRETLSAATIAKIREISSGGGASMEDLRARREEMLFERLVRSWEIAGMPPLTDQQMLLGRLRMASADELAWVRRTLSRHVEEYIPELAGR